MRPFFQKRSTKGAFQSDDLDMRENDGEIHFKYVWMSPPVFDKLLSLVKPHLRKRRRYKSKVRARITDAEKLVPTLKYLASGASVQDVSISFRLGHSTAHKIIMEVCKVIWLALADRYLPCPKTPSGWKAVAEEFYARWNMPHCVGAIDGKHVNMQVPYNSGSTFFNYKNHHSIILMAVADAQYRCLMVDVGARGRQSDGGVFADCNFGQALEDATAGIPDADSSVLGLGKFPNFLVGDEAFPLRGYLMRPYPGKNLSLCQRIFNYRLSRSRRIIENAFGILVAKWRIFRQPIAAHPARVEVLVKACVALHNFLQTEQSTTYSPAGLVDFEDAAGKCTDGSWRAMECEGLTPISKSGSNNYTSHAKSIRDDLAEFLVSPLGAVPWQVNSATRVN